MISFLHLHLFICTFLIICSTVIILIMNPSFPMPRWLFSLLMWLLHFPSLSPTQPSKLKSSSNPWCNTLNIQTLMDYPLLWSFTATSYLHYAIQQLIKYCLLFFADPYNILKENSVSFIKQGLYFVFSVFFTVIKLSRNTCYIANIYIFLFNIKRDYLF